MAKKKKRFIPKSKIEENDINEGKQSKSLFDEWKDFLYINGTIWIIIFLLTIYEEKFMAGDNTYRWLYMPVAITFLGVSLIGKFLNIESDPGKPEDI